MGSLFIAGSYQRQVRHLEQIPAKLHDFVDKDLLQPIDLARFLFGKVIPPCREAR
jgi:hypothetical protein